GFKTSDSITLITAPNQPPTVNIVTPTTGTHYITGDGVSIAANASDIDGTVSSVEFFVDGVSIGVDNSSPYTANYTSTLGTHTILAKATDDRGAQTTSSVSIIVANNVPPTVSITAPSTGSSVIAPALVTINATASDVDGSVTKVEFFVNNLKVAEDTTSPYSFVWASLIGSTNITAKATDNRGAVSTSSVVNITVNQASAQMNLGNEISSAPNSIISVPVNVMNLKEIGLMNIKITFDNSIMTFISTDNVSAQAAGISVNVTPISGNISQINISWLQSGTNGINFNDGKLLDLKFNYLGGNSSVSFDQIQSQAKDWNGNLINVSYSNTNIQNPKTVNLNLFLEGLYNVSTNAMLEAGDIDWGTGEVFPKYGVGIADKVNIDLYDENGPYTTPVASFTDVELATSGLVSFQISSQFSGNYYIRVRTRNHLEVWSAVPVSFSSSTVVYDFTTNALNAYQAPGGNDPQIQVYPGIFALYLGDLDQSLGVDFDDFNVFEPYLTDGAYGFTIADFNGNGLVDFDDFNLFEPRLNLGPFAQYPGMKKK
ncbi:MAG: Ig-like domain-containing protein, partial [Bacteroidota bacterium]